MMNLRLVINGRDDLRHKGDDEEDGEKKGSCSLSAVLK
jgi:hypothetical protein